MPIPERLPIETKDEFISRCISEIIDEYGQQQAAAICYSKLNRQSWNETKS